MSDPESGVGYGQLGCGTKVSNADAPDISSYAVLHQNNHYIKQSPALIGDKTVYLFIKVQNKAGREAKAWLGPILPDETPPICDDVNLVPFVGGRSLILNWTRSMFGTKGRNQKGDVLIW